MRASTLNVVTLREEPADAEIASHKLLTRGGFIVKSGSGIYTYGHFLHRVIDKIKRIVSEEISAAGGVEITMPIMQERELWEKSGRWAGYQASKTMLSVTDRGGQEFGLAPTAEEVVTDFADSQVSSYKQMPVCYFQQNTKFRDEIRPRFGLMRVKEFIMMDAYSFHPDTACLQKTYDGIRAAYLKAFNRCGLEAFAVEADTGSIGGSGSHEFMVAADVGEDGIAVCHQCGYAANMERAEGRIPAAPAWNAPADRVELHTPSQGGIADVVSHLNKEQYPDLTAAHMLKTVLFVAQTTESSHTVAAFIRGDRDVNEVKLTNAIAKAVGDEVLEVRAMTPAEVETATGAKPGFAGPGLTADVQLLDALLAGAQSPTAVVTGANKTDYHVVLPWDEAARDGLVVADLSLIGDGDGCPSCGATLAERRGIEVGHIFQLGDKYSQSMNAQFTGQDGKLHHFEMGCYGIGVSRVAAAAVEQHHDKFGMCWPMGLAPYHVVVVPVKAKNEEHMAAAEKLYEQFRAAGVEVLLDDRDAGPGVKFKDWDLIGMPIKVVAGRGLADGNVEIKTRAGDAADVAVENALAHVQGLIAAGLQG